MRTIFAEYNPQRNSIDVYTSAGYMLRIDCWEAEKNLKTTPGSDCALNALAIDEPLAAYSPLQFSHARFSEYPAIRVQMQYFVILYGVGAIQNAGTPWRVLYV